MLPFSKVVKLNISLGKTRRNMFDNIECCQCRNKMRLCSALELGTFRNLQDGCGLTKAKSQTGSKLLGWVSFDLQEHKSHNNNVALFMNHN